MLLALIVMCGSGPAGPGGPRPLAVEERSVLAAREGAGLDSVAVGRDVETQMFHLFLLVVVVPVLLIGFGVGALLLV